MTHKQHPPVKGKKRRREDESNSTTDKRAKKKSKLTSPNAAKPQVNTREKTDRKQAEQNSMNSDRVKSKKRVLTEQDKSDRLKKKRKIAEKIKQMKREKQRTTDPKPGKKNKLCVAHGSFRGCKKGEHCRFVHLEDVSVHQLYHQFYHNATKGIICLCSPENALPKYYKHTMEKKSKEKVLDVIGILVDLSEQELLTRFPEFNEAPDEHRENGQFWLQFPDTNVVIVIQKMPEEDVTCFKNVLKSESSGDEDEDEEEEEEEVFKSNVKIEDITGEDESKSDVGSDVNSIIAATEVGQEQKHTWTILGELQHQLCILNYLEDKLPNVIFAPNNTNSYHNALLTEFCEPDDRSQGNYPPLIERIFLHHFEKNPLDDDDEDDHTSFFFGDSDSDDMHSFFF